MVLEFKINNNIMRKIIAEYEYLSTIEQTAAFS